MGIKTISNIRIHTPNICHGWGIEFNFEKPNWKDDAQVFVCACMRLLVIPKFPGQGFWFHQSGSQEPTGYQFFEFWGNDAEKVVHDAARLVAAELGCMVTEKGD